MLNILNYQKKTSPARRLNLWLFIPALFLLLLSCSSDYPNNSKAKLRQKPKMLSISEAKKMILQKNFFDKYWNKSGSFENQFEAKEIENVKVVIDHASGLIWHQSGSNDFKNLDEAIAWTAELNI